MLCRQSTYMLVPTAVSVVVFYAMTAQVSAQIGTKSLIELGYDIPDTAFLRDNIAAIKSREPFNGVVYSARPNTGVDQEFTTGAWGNPTFSRASMQHALDELRETNFGQYNQNFLRVNAQPGNVDWFDDTSSLVANAATAAWLSGQGGTRGIFLDAEPYSSNLWRYNSQKYRLTKSFLQYAAQVRQRGQEVMNTMQAESPNLTILLPHSYTTAWIEASGNASRLPNITYGLLPAFLDGMLDVAGDGVEFVDGFEQAYGYRSLSQFQSAVTTSRTGVLPIVANDSRYAEKFSVGFPVWMDADWRDRGGFHTDPGEFGQNYYTPAQLHQTLSYALQTTDQYVWLYDETLFWRPDYRSPQVPDQYWGAVSAAFAPYVPEPSSASAFVIGALLLFRRRTSKGWQEK